MPLSGGYTNGWDEDAPDGATVQSSSIDDQIRQFKLDIRERIADLFGMTLEQFSADPMEPQSVPFNLLPLRRTVGPFVVAYGEMATTDVIMPIGSTSNPTYTNAWHVFRACKVKAVYFECSANVTKGTAKISLHGGTDDLADIITLSSTGEAKSDSLTLETPYALAVDASFTVSLEISGIMPTVFDTDSSGTDADVTFVVWVEIEDDIPTV